MEPKTSKTIHLTTPENILIELSLSDPSRRIEALFIDMLIMVMVFILMLFLLVFLQIAMPALESLWAILFVLGNFLLRNGYFIYYEMKWAATPGKKRARLKVVSQDGSFLPASSIYVRNLMREVEIWIPLQLSIFIVLKIRQDFTLSIFYPMLWILLLGVYPWIDRHNRRLGDILAGTVVIVTEKISLGKDLALKGKKASLEDGKYNFTEKMMDIYGKDELQTLEEILRESSKASAYEERELYKVVVEKICRKIGYPEKIQNSQGRTFLVAFYEAQRAHLEKKLLHGKSL